MEKFDTVSNQESQINNENQEIQQEPTLSCIDLCQYDEENPVFMVQ